jgi:O-antigen/teichoic acid export membrane protein
LQKEFFRSLLLLVILNLVVKPVWIFGIDRPVQNLTGFAAYGEYFALLNLCIILNFLLDLGISAYFNREVAAKSEDGIVLFSQALTGKLVLSVLYFCVVSAIAFYSGIREFQLLLMLIVMQVGSSFLLFLRAYLTASQQYRSDSIISITDKLIVILFAGALILFPGFSGGITIKRFAVIQVGAIFFSIILGLYFLVRHVPGFTIRPFKGFKSDLLLSSLPFALNIFLMALMARADGFLLERMHQDGAAEAGIYAAGYRLLDAFNMVGFLMAGFLLPFISRNWPGLERFSPVLLACRHLLVLGSLLVVAFVFADPEYLTVLLYHKKDPYTSTVMTVILTALPALSMVHIYGTTLTATRHIRAFLRITLVFAMINLALNMLFIPQYGAMACAIIAVCTQTGYALAVIYTARKKTGIGLWLSFMPVYLAAGLTLFAILRLSAYLHLNLLLSACIGTVAISMVFFYRAGFSFRQLRQLLTEK